MYSYDNFLKTITDNDTLIKILDNNGVVRYSIDPFSVVNTFINNNLVKISLKDSIIVIDFSTLNESKLALPILQNAITLLRDKLSLLIDKKIENYVENKFQETTTLIELSENKFTTNGPTSSNSEGLQGDLLFDSNFLYVCIDNDNWKRIPLQSF
jgi:hypothetical protein